MTHYLDHAATTPVRPEVLDAWMRTARDLAKYPGNPSSLHGGGRRARLALDEAREQIASALGAERAEVIFTSGATESDALAVAGGARGIRAAGGGVSGAGAGAAVAAPGVAGAGVGLAGSGLAGPAGASGRGGAGRRVVLVGGAEHDAVLEQGEVLRRDGFAWGLLPINEDGVAAISAQTLAEAVRDALAADCALAGAQGALADMTGSALTEDAAAGGALAGTSTGAFAETPGSARTVYPGHEANTRPALVNPYDALALVSLGLVSSEVGTLQPVRQLVEAIYSDATAGGAAGRTGEPGSAASQLAATRGQRPLIHTDAAQAIGLIPVDFHALGVDLLSIGGHKVGAPVGVGVLLVRRGVPVTTDRPGGGHERGIRSGTPDVAGAVALACAIDLAVASQHDHWDHATALRDHLLHGIAQVDYDIWPSVNPAAASPSIIHLRVPTRHPEALLLAMDAAGIHVSAGSACHAGVTRPSAVMIRMGHSENDALGVLRISTGRDTTTADIDAFIAALPDAIAGAQRLDALDRPR